MKICKDGRIWGQNNKEAGNHLGISHKELKEHRKGVGRATRFKKGKNNPNWKGGRYVKRDYTFLLQPKHPYANSFGYVREHRLIIEKQIGRFLSPEEKCHHLGKKADNRPHMLMAFTTDSAHKRFEKGGKVKKEEIIFDGKGL